MYGTKIKFKLTKEIEMTCGPFILKSGQVGEKILWEMVPTHHRLGKGGQII